MAVVRMRLWGGKEGTKTMQRGKIKIKIKIKYGERRERETESGVVGERETHTPCTTQTSTLGDEGDEGPAGPRRGGDVTKNRVLPWRGRGGGRFVLCRVCAPRHVLLGLACLLACLPVCLLACLLACLEPDGAG